MSQSAHQTKTTETILRGTRVSACDLGVLKRSCKKLKLAVDPSDRDAMVVTLADYFVKLHGGDHEKILHCEDCNGPSDESYDACPYCGARDSDPPKNQPAADKPPAPTVAAAKKGAEKPARKPEPSEPAPAEQFPGIARAPVGTALEGELLTEHDLDRSVATMLALHLDVVGDMRKLAEEVARCHGARLYTLRKSADGKPKYKDWNQFTKAELRVSGSYALKLMTVAREFGDETIQRVGVTKLSLLASVANLERRETLLDQAKQDLTRGDLARQVRDEREREGGRDTGRRGNQPRKPATPAELAEKSALKKRQVEAVKRTAAREGVTAIMQLAAYQAACYRVDLPGERATAHTLPAVSRIDMLNDSVHLVVTTTVDPDGRLSHVAEFVRVNRETEAC